MSAPLPDGHAVTDDPRPSLLGEEPLRLGDAVTHTERGLAALLGLEPTPELPGTPPGEVIRLGFKGEETILVPVEEAGCLYAYGAEAEHVTLDAADGDWAERRAEVETQMAETAAQIVALAEERRGREAPVIAPGEGFEAVCEGFAHPLTEDQAAACEAVLADLAAGRPMDRVVVGDVGYGKTEVAVRAAAAAVSAGFQVAVACPTTVLCRQHADLFKERLAAMGASVLRLSSLETEAEHEEAEARAADGTADVIVGTHALTTGIGFARLGLVVIDEEQRFGAERKEALRTLSDGIHTLTLSATPIPKTLAAAEAGLLDLSLVATPPGERVPIVTERGTLDRKTVKAALAFEAERGGRSFVVCPRIADMEAVRALIERAVPDLTVGEVHGDMSAHAIEEAMTAFRAGETDVLLCTSIIETGVDVPEAGTMIVTAPDRFGLGQLHQLRGRVGRGGQEGRVHLLIEPKADLSGEAERRLDTLVRLSRLGAGFEVAARDLSMRGAGEWGGTAQTGHDTRLGIGLARVLMRRAIEAARGEAAAPALPDIGACGTGLIPESYIADPITRLRLYIEVARVENARGARVLRERTEAAHGPLPDAVRALFEAGLLRALCRRAGIEEIDAGPKAIAVTFSEAAREKKSTAKRVERAQAAYGEGRWSKGRLVFDHGSDAPCDAARDLVSAMLG